MRKSIIRRCLGMTLICVVLCCYRGAPAADQAKSEPVQVPPAGQSKTSVDQPQPTIGWRPYEDGLALAKAENKKAFLYFYTTRCHYCNIMEKKTFTNDQVIALLNDQFVPIRVDLGTKPAFASFYKINGVPVSWFLESNGQPIGSRPGFLAPDQFTEMLKFVLTEKYKKTSAK